MLRKIASILIPPRVRRKVVKRLPWITAGRLGLGRNIAPFSEIWGNDRGTPVHRHYLHKWLGENRDLVRGNCLEFQDPLYTQMFGGEKVLKLDVVDLSAENPKATIVCDLTDPAHPIPPNSLDCIICTHVLHIVYEQETFLRHCHDILKSGGSLLLAVPSVSMNHPKYPELWRYTAFGVETLLKKTFPGGEITVSPFGNSLTAAGEIRGLAAEEFTAEELDALDARFSLEICAVAKKANLGEAPAT